MRVSGVTDLNYAFFEEFKRLDKLCGDLYKDQYGITHYIDDMKSVSGVDYQHIPDWKTDLDRLIRLRHIRNYLAHTEGAFNEEVCTQKDIEWLQSFYKRILNQLDPLAMLHQYFKEKQEMARRLIAQPPASQSPTPQSSSNHKILYGVVFFLTIIGGTLLVILILMALFIFSIFFG